MSSLHSPYMSCALGQRIERRHAFLLAPRDPTNSNTMAVASIEKLLAPNGCVVRLRARVTKS